jgi:uncharacterized membrane protein YeaQ/YmgE (transglycosylase-associated protein family)
MNFLNFIAWLTAGAVVGWFASRMVEAERRRKDEVNPIA